MKTARQVTRIGLIMLVLAALAAGCDGRDFGQDVSSIRLQWQLEGTDDLCAGRIEFVYISVYRGDPFTDGEFITQDMVPCQDGSWEVDDLDPGQYYLRLEAVCRYDAIGYQHPSGGDDGMIDLIPGVNDLGTLTLAKVMDTCD
jgi:hypothetical protein